MAETSDAPDSTPIRVLIADKTRMNTQLLAHSLAHDSRFLVIEAESTPESILALMDSEKPDVVLLSATLNGNSTAGFKVVRQLRALHPEGHIVMFLDASERSSVVESFRAGARGIFCRTESLKSLAKCIQCAQSGQVWANTKELGYLLGALSEAVSIGTPDGGNLSSLSKRERDVVLCVAEGLSNREIAHRLNLTEHTVKNYLFRVFDKLKVSSRVEVVLYAFKLMQSSDTSKPGEKASAKQANRTAASVPPGHSRPRK